MSILKNIVEALPEVEAPKEKKLSFKKKLIWTLIVLVLFFVLGTVPLYGLGLNALQRFDYLSIILGAKFGSIISLGIGPIVTASIILQLLNGAKLVNFDLHTHEGKEAFQDWQKLLTLFFILFEALIYVLMGGLAPDPALIGTSLYTLARILLISQLFIGGYLIVLMDQVVSKWGFGSGVSLFIAAGVSQEIFVKALNFMPSPLNPDIASGAIPAIFQALAQGDPITVGLKLAAIISTIIVFLVVVYAQAMKVEIPLSFGRVRGQGMRWPLRFIYASNIPVILVAALMANIQLWGRLLQNWGHPIFGTFVGNSPSTGLVSWLYAPNIIGNIIRGSATGMDFVKALVYLGFMMIGSIIFAVFWVKTSGMDAESQAENMMQSGLQVPGFRKDKRILVTILKRYIGPLTVMGGATVGFLAAFADLTGALSRGTGILLAVMIVYQIYEEVAKQHMMDMSPAMRKLIK